MVDKIVQVFSRSVAKNSSMVPVGDNNLLYNGLGGREERQGGRNGTIMYSSRAQQRW